MQYSSDLTYYTLGNVIRNMKQQKKHARTQLSSHTYLPHLCRHHVMRQDQQVWLYANTLPAALSNEKTHDMILLVLLDVDIGLYH